MADALEGLRAIDGVTLYGDPPDRVPTLMFNVDGLTSAQAATALAEREVAVWDGNYYAYELERFLGLDPDGAVRAGLRALQRRRGRPAARRGRGRGRRGRAAARRRDRGDARLARGGRTSGAPAPTAAARRCARPAGRTSGAGRFGAGARRSAAPYPAAVDGTAAARPSGSARRRARSGSCITTTALSTSPAPSELDARRATRRRPRRPGRP